MVRNANTNLVTLSPLETDSPPLVMENAAPTKSRKILNLDHPLVLFLFQFQYTAGLYFMKLSSSFPYPMQLTGLKYSVEGRKWTSYVIYVVLM